MSKLKSTDRYISPYKDEYADVFGGAFIKDVTRYGQIVEPEMDYLQRIRDLEQALNTAKGIISQQQRDLEESRTGKEKTEVYLDGRINDLKEILHKTYEKKKNLEIEYADLRKARDNIKIEIEYWRKEVQELEQQSAYSKRLKSEEASLEQDVIRLQSKAKEWAQYISKLKDIDDMETAYKETVDKIEKIEQLKMKKIEDYLTMSARQMEQYREMDEALIHDHELDKPTLWERLWS